ncbi:MAG: hypothetical protein ACE5H0_11065, partial [Bacteroidota bacterium]
MTVTMPSIKLRWIALGIVSFLVNSLGGQEAGTITGTVTVRGLRNASNVVVYIDKFAGKKFEPPNEHAVMDQINLKFVPHVLPILVGTSVDFPNSDEVRHNVFTPSEVGGKFNLGQYPKGVVKTVTFPKPGIVVLLCNVHTEMSAYVVVLETPYFGVTEVKLGQREGHYTIEDVPPGTYVLKAWHRKAMEAE